VRSRTPSRSHRTGIAVSDVGGKEVEGSWLVRKWKAQKVASI
jgi:hypothetical protein